MDQGLLPRRYAKALYKFAVEKGDAAQVYGMMQNLAKAFVTVPGLQHTIANPYGDTKQKTQLIETAAGNNGAQGSKGGETLADFVKLLVRNHRIDIVRDIALAYANIYRTANHIYGVTITSAKPLDEADRSRLSKLVTDKLKGGTAEITFNTDPSLIGGFVINIDSEQLDTSVKTQLEQLRQRLTV